jgi:hypothetical protein
MAGTSSKGSKLFVSALIIAVADRIANLTSIGAVGAETDEMEVTDLDSLEYKEFVMGLKDGGSVDIAGNMLVGGTGYAKLKGFFDSSTLVHFGVSHPTVEEASLAFDGFVKKIQVGERTATGALTFTATIRISGAITDFVTPVA